MTTQAPTAAEVAGKLSAGRKAIVVASSATEWQAAFAIARVARMTTATVANAIRSCWPDLWHRAWSHDLSCRLYRLNEAGLAVRAILMEQDRHGK